MSNPCGRIEGTPVPRKRTHPRMQMISPLHSFLSLPGRRAIKHSCVPRRDSARRPRLTTEFRGRDGIGLHTPFRDYITKALPRRASRTAVKMPGSGYGCVDEGSHPHHTHTGRQTPAILHSTGASRKVSTRHARVRTPHYTRTGRMANLSASRGDRRFRGRRGADTHRCASANRRG